jgi:subtilisin family serine protease
MKLFSITTSNQVRVFASEREAPTGEAVFSSAGQYDPYVIVIGGQPATVGGTSAAAPIFAGIIALVHQNEGSGGQGTSCVGIPWVPGMDSNQGLRYDAVADEL